MWQKLQPNWAESIIPTLFKTWSGIKEGSVCWQLPAALQYQALISLFQRL
jgi:hypothetical protein